MMRSLYSGVSGLKNHQTRMDVIGNNISNVNTTGFKSSRVVFADMLSQTLTGASAPDGTTLGGTNPKQIGLGSSVSSIDLLFTNGSVQSTGKNTDLCLSSTNALFIMKSTNGTFYTRNGAFEFDADGNYVQPGSGMFVQGWMGEFDKANNKWKDPDPTSAVTNITIPSGKSMAPTKTTSATYSNNLNAKSPIGTKIATTLTVYGTEGFAHDVVITFTKKSANTWTPSATSSSYKDSAGNSVSDTVAFTTTPDLVFDENGVYKSGGNTAKLTVTNGEKTPFEVTVDFSKLTQYDQENTIAGTADDGNAAGTLSSISIDKTGVITGNYTNGMKQAEAQVALQRFTNPSGLEKTGDSLYQDSNNAGKSGEPNTATALGATITPSALEMSNVDIANEFTDMIVTQRGFQSNSKIITVSDEMLETLINLKR